MRKKSISVTRAIAAFSMPFFLCLGIAGCEDATILEDETEPPLVNPLPQPEIPDDPVDEYDETEILNHVKSDFSWWEDVRPRKRQELSFERGTRCVKLCSDSRYIYGYVEIDTSKVLSRTGKKSPEYLNTLGVWLDTDDVHAGQGGGWFMSASSKGFDRLLRGRCSDCAEPQDWKPSVYDVSMGGDTFGQTDPVAGGWINAGTGMGMLEDNIFRYTFTVDRVRLGIDDMDEVCLGISFDSGGYTDYTVIPDRTGFMLRLGNGDEIEYDIDGTEEPAPDPVPDPEPDPDPDPVDIGTLLKTDLEFWKGIDEADRGTDTQFERGTKCVKFNSDSEYLYGYVEVDLTKIFEKGTENTRPDYLNHLGIWLDTDGIHEGQGGGWALSKSPKGYDVLIYGRCSDNGTPQRWTPEVHDVSKPGDSFRTAVETGWENYAAGDGQVADDLFFYTFVIDRKCLGDTGEAIIGITFNFQYNAYNDHIVVPARCGFTVPLAK
ncbi:MAG: hypothetical protein NC308_05565 [Clostridium sp.]|nr:hypothetical protein [Bacteroides sp.]MCM1198337.1 hypothetical protein [Clostridium sp.]